MDLCFIFINGTMDSNVENISTQEEEKEKVSRISLAAAHTRGKESVISPQIEATPTPNSLGAMYS